MSITPPLPPEPPQPPDTGAPALQPTAAATFRDRSGGLQVFGVMQIICGALFLLFIPLMLLGALTSLRTTGTRMPMGTYLLTCLSYGALAVVQIVLGIGSIRCRRWARALNLILSWVALFGGISVTIFMTAILPTAFAAALRHAAASSPNGAVPPAGVTAVILTFIIVFMAIFLIAIPLAFVLFYSRKDVAETCRLRDPVERWTDRCPLPVLAASILFTYGAIYYVFLGITTPMMPFFGRYLTGIPGSAFCLAHGALDILLAMWLYRLRLWAWWLALASLILFAISAAITYRYGNLLSAYSRMGWTQAQLDLMNRSPMFRGHLILWWSLVYLVAGIVYLLFIKRYF
ncbi:MAG TPA: hypothetical protein VF753_11545, partial [Terriglobales bacterium]